ncbi:MAG: carbamoyltransferase HypF [Pyrinomonadaceae bacterium]
MQTRKQIQIKGIVQGVGFRPFVFALASRGELKGRVLNNEIGVLVDVEGEQYRIEQFINELRTMAPPLSQIDSVECKPYSNGTNYADFRIVESETIGQKFSPISADIATCADCLREMLDENDRRFRYPFINCTNCGPRFTIIDSVPYDRENTTMSDFEMCAACRSEYEDPQNRRFHAEPTCCPDCGPSIFLCDAATLRREEKGGNTTGREGGERNDSITAAKALLDEGKILAVKGVGGYHLVCDALNAGAIETLRQRKYREDKPFALMAVSLEVIEKYCFVSRDEKDLLLSRERPIVLLERHQNTILARRVSAAETIPDAVAPRMTSLGFMLPYTPLHHLLLENIDRPLVMTSGNVSDEPIAYTDRDAGERLSKIADYYLLHDRRIHIRMDDSVARVLKHSSLATHHLPLVLRRSRGYAPAPVKTSFKFEKQILACGAELKNTFCLTKDNYAFVSHHIGDLENLETLKSFTMGIEHYKKLFNLEPEVIAYDLHPEYLSTKYAHSCDGVETKIGIQHHHAHIASCMADNGATGEVIGVAMDGLGFGTDGKMWGGEFFVADFAHAERIAHLDYVPLPGGAKAIREPWRMAAAYLQRTFGDAFLDLDIPFVNELDREKWSTVASMIASGTNCPETSSMGRLFDAVSSLLCLRSTVNFEGQAAIELEAIANKAATKSYEFTLRDGGIIKAESIFKQAVADLLDGVSAAEVSARFHLAIAGLIVDVATLARETNHLNRVVLSGGVFQNMFLLKSAVEMMRVRDFEVLTHRRVPCNDGGISLGQAAIANARLQNGSI